MVRFSKAGGLALAEGSHPRTATPHKRVGSLVRGKYRVEAFLATGTMANVYAATHRNGAKVALKILHRQLAEDAALCQRFKQEGYFANSIDHPGVVRAIDDDVTEDGCPFLVMELLEGETLDERRRRKGGKLALSWLLPVADSLLDVLGAAHAREIVHRDLKPDNIFVTKRGDVKVLDFGVARWADGNESSDMTAVGMVLGTPAYMPPEQALGRREEVDAQSDIWAVGATLFSVLSGESVHEGGDAKAKLIATARTAARPLRDAAPEVPRAVATVIDRALAFHKSERWPDVQSMREALRWARRSVEERPSYIAETATSEPQIEAIPPPVPTRRTLDDEPTIARPFPKEALRSAAPVESGPRSSGFLTSAPPITLRDVPNAPDANAAWQAPMSADPVFSLRRERGGDNMPPSTVRTTNEQGAPVLPSLASSDDGDSSDHARAMATYDPGSAIGDFPVGSANVPRSVEVNLSFTRPMAAAAAPQPHDVPGPAAGAAKSEPPPMFPPPAFPSAPPDTYGSSPPHVALGTGPPPPMMTASSPPPGFAQLPTAPAFRAQAERSAPPSNSAVAPGPLLSEIVPPTRGRTARIVVPLALALVAFVAIVLVMRARAADASGSAAVGAEPSTPIASALPPASAVASAVRGPAPKNANVTATSAAASASPATEPVATEVKRPKPKPKRRRAPKPKTTAAAEEVAPATTAATTAEAPEARDAPAPTPEAPAPEAPAPTPAPTPTPTTPPAAPTPMDSLPRKEPDPPMPIFTPRPAPAAPESADP